MILFLLGSCLAFAAEVATPNSSLSPEDQDAAGRSPFLSDAERCGTTCQNNNTPDKHGGNSMCGRSVQEMVQCMSRSLNSTEGCTGRCGHGKNFVDCESGQLEKCGYEKIKSGLDKRCSMPGAVLAYSKTETDAGKIYGHVEFVCGVQKYCSVYKREHNQPWPRPVADACWYPKQKAGEFEKLIGSGKETTNGNVVDRTRGSSGDDGGNARVPASQLLMPLMRRNQQPTRNVQRTIQQRPANGNRPQNSVVDPSP